MQRFLEWCRRVSYLLHRRRMDDELRREMEAHRAEMGTPSRFGNTLALYEDARDAWGWRWLDDLAHDARFAIRTFATDRAFVLTVIATLAVGIAAATATFTIVDGVMLRPLPFRAPDRLVRVSGQSVLGEHGPVADLDGLRRQCASFDALAGYEAGARYLRTENGPIRVAAVLSDADFFTVLGAPARIGRTFVSADGPDVAVIGEAFWRRALNSDPAVVGRTLAFTDRTVTIVGVMPADFQYPYAAASVLPGVASASRTDVWMRFDGGRPIRRAAAVIGRLKAGQSIAAAQREAQTIADRLASATAPQEPVTRIALDPLRDAVVPPPLKRLLWLVFGSALLLLALACANVTTLTLVRMTRRSQEMAMRRALGASGTRLIRQACAEQALLLGFGALAGVVLAWVGIRTLLNAASAYVPRAHEIAFDWRTAAFVVAATAIIGLGVALIAVLASDAAKGTRAFSAIADVSGGRTTTGSGARQARDVLVVLEIAITVVLCVGAALLLRELDRLRTTDPGLAARDVMTFHLGYRSATQADPQQFYRIEAAARQLPGVTAAGLTQLVPLQNWGWYFNSSTFVVKGRPPAQPDYPIQLRFVTPGYFDAVGVPIRAGRPFADRDSNDTAPVVIINETLAKRCCAGFDPVGHETTRGTVVGVVGDIRQTSLDLLPEPELYTAVAQNYSQVSDLGMTLLVRGGGSSRLVDLVRSVVHDVNPELAVFNVKSMDRVIADSLTEFTLYLSLAAAFALVALILALTGTYAVIAYMARTRRKEFATRVALGATGWNIAWQVLGRTATMTVAGIAIGVAVALAVAPVTKGLPVAVRPPDATTILPLSLAIAVIALLAALVPAVRAALTNPIDALKEP